MDPVQVPAYLAIASNAVAVFFVVHGYFRRLATKDDMKNLNDRLGNVEVGQTQMLERMSALETRQTALEGRLSAVEKKTDASHELHNSVHIDLKVLQSSVNRLESYFEAPKLRAN